MTEPTAGFAHDAGQEARQIFLKRKRAYWQTPWPAGKTDAWICAALAAVTLLLACRRIWAGGFGWSDAPLHAMDGAFLLDAVRAWPRNDPVGWAENYYAHFPCLGFVVYWPPGFAVLEAMAFAVFGLHALVARATVALCAATAVALAYLVGRRISGRAGGVCFALLLATCPFGMQWARQVMLEWPAVMWILLAVYAAVRFADEPTLPMGVVAGLAVLAAYMTKQQAGHIALVALAMPIVRADRWSAVPWWKMVIPVLLAMGGILYYHKIVSPYCRLTPYLTAGSQPWMHLLRPGTWLYYPVRLHEILGLPMLLTGAAGTAMLVLARKRGVLLLAVVWLLGAYLACTIPAWKEVRYGFWLIAPAAFLAGAGLVEATPARARIFAVAAVMLAAAWQVRTDLARPVYRPSDYAPAVAWLADKPDADVVLIDGLREGQFVWDLRRNARAAWRIIPLRGSKVLYSRAARNRWLYSEHVKSEQDIADLLSKYGIRYIIAEWGIPAGADPDQYDPRPRRLLRSLLESDGRFTLAARWPITGDPAWRDVELRAYTWHAPKRTADYVEIPIPAAGRKVRVRLPNDKPAGSPPNDRG